MYLCPYLHQKGHILDFLFLRWYVAFLEMWLKWLDLLGMS